MSKQVRQTEQDAGPALGDRMLVFRAGSRRYALPLAIVIEVFEIGDPAPVPGAPEWVSGMINHHGRVIPVLAMSLLAADARSDRAAKQVVLVELAGERLGLAVDQIESLEEGELKVTGALDGSGGRCAWYRGEMLEIYDAGALLAAIERKIESRGAEVDGVRRA